VYCRVCRCCIFLSQAGQVATGTKSFAGNILFIRSCRNGFSMDPKGIVLLVICFAAIYVAGCMTHSPPPAGTTAPTSLPQTTTASTVPPAPAAECTRAEDCVPAECCHPTSCTPGPKKQPCNLMCTQVCEGPLDCGAGSCGCVNGKCSVVRRSSVRYAPALYTDIMIIASPRRYSPVMSSTPGVGLELTAVGFPPENASFAWNATYGHFLSWNSPDFRVNKLGDSAGNHGEKLYWSFIDKPPSTATPVTITVTATEIGSGRHLASSTITLVWEDNYSVIVRDEE
jgi:hypothetical protein